MLNAADLMAFVPVSDLGRAREFYEGTLGLEVRQADDYGCVVSSNGTRFRLTVVEDYARPSFTVLGWLVPSVETMVATLMAAGLTMHRYEGMGQDEAGIWRAPSGDRVAWFSDSEGNNLSITQPGIGAGAEMPTAKASSAQG